MSNFVQKSVAFRIYLVHLFERYSIFNTENELSVWDAKKSKKMGLMFGEKEE